MFDFLHSSCNGRFFSKKRRSVAVKKVQDKHCVLLNTFHFNVTSSVIRFRRINSTRQHGNWGDNWRLQKNLRCAFVAQKESDIMSEVGEKTGKGSFFSASVGVRSIFRPRFYFDIVHMWVYSCVPRSQRPNYSRLLFTQEVLLLHTADTGLMCQHNHEKMATLHQSFSLLS